MKWLLLLVPGGLVLFVALELARRWRRRRERFISRRWHHDTQRHASAVEIRDGLRVLATVPPKAAATVLTFQSADEARRTA